MSEAAAARWRRQLEAWAIPQDLLDAVPDSPYEWPVVLWKRRSEQAREAGEETPTTAVVRALLPPGGSLLDVGAGAGRASLPLAGEGYRLTAVEKNPDAAQAFREESAALGVDAVVVEGAWPEVEVPVHDVALCAHVVYDVQDIEPFLVGLAGHARRAVVVELTESHPWAGLAPYYRALHDLDRPEGPTVDDLVESVADLFETEVCVERWSRPGHAWYESWDELIEHYGRRLVLPRRRWAELRDLMAPDVTDRDGRLYVGSPERRLATVWWMIGGSCQS